MLTSYTMTPNFQEPYINSPLQCFNYNRFLALSAKLQAAENSTFIDRSQNLKSQSLQRYRPSFFTSSL